MTRFIGLILAFAVCALYAGASKAETIVGAHVYTWHADPGNVPCTVGTCQGLYNNRTRGLYVVQDGLVAGAFCNSFSLPQYNNVNTLQQRSCNLTYHAGKVWRLSGGDSWDVSASLEAAIGYKENKPALVRVRGVADIIAIPTISARYGLFRATVLGPNALHLSVEYRLQ